MRKSRKGKAGARVFITLLGAAFILWGAALFVLGIGGERATAAITHIRREGGERNEMVSGRYTYIISYTFSLPDGSKVDGYTRKIGDSVYLKADGKSATAVRYFAFFPYINAIEAETKPGLQQLILVAAGVFLILIINKRKNA